MITPVLLKAIQEATKDRNAARPFFKKLIHLLNVYSIEYVIDGGALLGAMRDGEEIIWDDDYDIYMTRPNMEKLNAVLKKNITFTTDETYEPFAVRGFDYHFEFSPIGDTATKRIEFFNIIAITDETSEFVPIHICDVFYEGDKSGWPHPTIAELYPMRKAQLGDMELSIPNRAVEYLERIFGQNCINEYTVCNKYLYERGWRPDEKHEYKVINKSIYDKLKLQFQTHNAVDDRMKASRKRNNNRNNEVLRDKQETMKENASSKSSEPPLQEKDQVNSNQVNSNQANSNQANSNETNNNENKLLEQMQKRAQHLLDEQHKKLLSVQQNHQQELKSIQKAHRQEMENMQNNHEKDLARMRDLLHEQAKLFSESVNKRYNNDNDNDIDIENRQRYLDAKAKRKDFQKDTAVANDTKNDESIIKDRFVIEHDDHDHEEHRVQPNARNEGEDETHTKDEEHVENEKDEAKAQNEEDETQVENEEDKTQVKDEEHVKNEEHETQEQDEVKEDDSNANKPPEKNDVKQEVATTISNKQAKKKRGRGKNTVSLEITE